PELERQERRHRGRAIAGGREDDAAWRFNTAGAKLIELNNYLTTTYSAAPATPRGLAEPLVLMLAPMCPHIAEELWHRLGHPDSLVHGPFPVADDRYLVADTAEYAIQAKGRVRSRVPVAADADGQDVRAAAPAADRVGEPLGGG